ncbi:PcfH protein, partial [Enterococcus faecalis]
LAFLFLITPIVILATDDLRIEWASWVGWLLFGLLVLLFHYLAALCEDFGGCFVDFSRCFTKVPCKLWTV